MAYKRKKDGIFMGEDGRWRIHNRCATRIYWTPQMISDLKRFFPTTLNDELAEILMVSPRTLIRKARELGIEKDKKWLQDIWAERRMLANARSKELGYPGTYTMNKERRQRNDKEREIRSAVESIAN